MNIRKILHPTDFSPCSKNALGFALSIAEPVQAKVDVLHVWREPYFVAPELLITLPNRSTMSVGDWVLSEAMNQMTQLLKDIEHPVEVEMTSFLERGDPFETILRLAEEGIYDLIVMGTGGRSGLSRVFMGSVTEKVLRASPIPVLTVRHEVRRTK